MGGVGREARGRRAASRGGQRDPVFPERRIRAGVSGRRELRRDQALQHFGCVRARGRSSGGPCTRRRAVPRSLAGGTTASYRAISALRCRRTLKELGHPVNDFEGRIDFDLRDVIRLEQAKHGMVADGHPTRGVAGEDRGEVGPQMPLVPAKAGTRTKIRKELDARFRGHERSALAREQAFLGTSTSPFMIGRAVRKVPATTSMSAPLPVVCNSTSTCPDGCSIQMVRGLASSGFASSCAIEPSSAQAVDDAHRAGHRVRGVQRVRGEIARRDRAAVARRREQSDLGDHLVGAHRRSPCGARLPAGSARCGRTAPCWR